MKIFALFLLAIVSIFALNFFIPESEDTEKRLIMRAYVFDESVTDPNDWQGENVFAFEELEVGKPRFAAPTSGAGIFNINIEFEYDGGVVEAYSEDVQISIGDGFAPFWDKGKGKHINYDDRMFGYHMHISGSGCMAFKPVRGGGGYYELDEKHGPLDPTKRHGFEGNETFVTVKAYREAGEEWPVATAVIKFTQLMDRTQFDGIFEEGYDDLSRFFEIELISYD